MSFNPSIDYSQPQTKNTTDDLESLKETVTQMQRLWSVIADKVNVLPAAPEHDTVSGARDTDDDLLLSNEQMATIVRGRSVAGGTRTTEGKEIDDTEYESDTEAEPSLYDAIFQE
jgi:hypothetical protein